MINEDPSIFQTIYNKILKVCIITIYNCRKTIVNIFIVFETIQNFNLKSTVRSLRYWSKVKHCQYLILNTNTFSS